MVTREEKLEEVCRSLIYHGRNFSKRRDEVVLKKSVNYIKSIFKKRRKL